MPAADYYLTTNFENRLLPVMGEKVNMCPWRSWIARVTPTHKVAGSNPVGHTKIPPKFDFSEGFCNNIGIVVREYYDSMIKST